MIGISQFKTIIHLKLERFRSATEKFWKSYQDQLKGMIKSRYQIFRLLTLSRIVSKDWIRVFSKATYRSGKCRHILFGKSLQPITVNCLQQHVPRCHCQASLKVVRLFTVIILEILMYCLQVNIGTSSSTALSNSLFSNNELRSRDCLTI